LRPAGTVYRHDDVYPGYGITVQQLPQRPWPIRASLGVDFVEFPGFSTGVIHLLGGTAVSVVRSTNRTLSFLVVGQAGTLLFLEPSTTPRLAGGVGLELGLRPGGTLGLLLGVNGLVADGPAGAFVAIQPRLGLLVPL
jgi:hypothetical protein